MQGLSLLPIICIFVFCSSIFYITFFRICLYIKTYYEIPWQLVCINRKSGFHTVFDCSSCICSCHTKWQ